MLDKLKLAFNGKKKQKLAYVPEPEGNTSDLTPFNPTILVAGSAELAKGKVYRPAFEMIAEALDTDDVRFVYSVQDGRVWYIGAREQDFTVAGRLGTTLATALPGVSGHQGDGAYLFEAAISSAMVVFKSGRLTSYSGTTEMLARIAEGLEVPVISVQDARLALAWESDGSLSKRKARSLIKKVLLIGGAVLAIASTLAVGSAAVKGYLTPVNDRMQANIGNVLRKASDELDQAKEQPVYIQIAGMQKIFDVVLTYKGRVDYYKVEKGSAPVWKIELPVWAPGHAYANLAAKPVVYEKDGLIIVTNDPKDSKGVPNGK